MEGLTVGRVVHYALSTDDAKIINERRIAVNQPAGERLPGVQYHIGNPVESGEHCAMVITQVWNTDGLINGKVVLDGLDDYWATSRRYSEQKEPGTWHWIEKA